MDRDDYKLVAQLLSTLQPMQETPEGQKFHISEIVKISNPISWFAKKSYEKDKDRLYRIECSYYQKFGGDINARTKQYHLKHLFEDNSTAWYDESELELVKGIDEIREEYERSEYQRLKTKYETANLTRSEAVEQIAVLQNYIKSLDTQINISDDEIFKIYMLGFNDEFENIHQKFDNRFIQHAYSWGQIDAVAGDDVPSLNYRSNEEILRMIKTTYDKIHAQYA